MITSYIDNTLSLDKCFVANMVDDMSPKKVVDADTLPSVIRIPEATRERLKRVGDALSKRALTDLPASVIVRAVLERGLDSLEAELGLGGKGKR